MPMVHMSCHHIKASLQRCVVLCTQQINTKLLSLLGSPQKAIDDFHGRVLQKKHKDEPLGVGPGAYPNIECDEVTVAKRRKEGGIQDMKILTLEEETAAMTATDVKMPTLRQELGKLIELSAEDTKELKNMAETKN
eukprot:2332960-Amphidinium_carterae.1